MGFLFSKCDHIPVLGASVGLGSPAEIDRLKDICLSLAVVPVKNIYPAGKMKRLVSVISEIFQPQIFYSHLCPFGLLFAKKYTIMLSTARAVPARRYLL